MSVLQAIRDYLYDYQKLKDNVPVWVNMLGPDVTSYSISPVPGKKVTEDILGNKVVEYPFAFYSTDSTADEVATLETAEFYEEFSMWLEEQTENEIFPELGSNRTVEKIEALDLETLMERSENTGVYQILCKLTYEERI